MILYEYEDLLMGKRKSFEIAFTDSVEWNKKAAGIIWRYAIETLLGWTPEQALIYLNQELVKSLKLDKTLVKIGYEYSAKKFFDYRYVLQYAFPESVSYTVAEDARAEYERVAKLGQWSDDKEDYKFHKNYFAGSEGAVRASEVLNYAISIDLNHLDDYGLYEFFGNKKDATEWLKKRNIEINIKSLFKTPLEYYHYSLPVSEANNVYYINEWLKNKYL